jgi:hypothetical protein
MPIIQELQERGWTVGLPELSMIVVVVATVSYYAIERPFLTWFRAGESSAAARVPTGTRQTKGRALTTEARQI